MFEGQLEPTAGGPLGRPGSRGHSEIGGAGYQDPQKNEHIAAMAKYKRYIYHICRLSSFHIGVVRDSLAKISTEFW